MSAEPVERLERYQASLEAYLALPEGVRAEYVDGEVIVTAPAGFQHNRVSGRLFRLLEDHLPGLVVVFETGLRTAGARYRVPDLLVVPADDEAVFTEQVPVIVVEILSSGTRAEDTIRKAPEYLEAGVEQYWLVDRQARSIEVLTARIRGRGREWRIALTIDPGNPVGEVHVGDHGTVPLDLGAIMPE